MTISSIRRFAAAVGAVSLLASAGCAGPDPAPADTPAATGNIAVTTASDAAREAYLRGRDLNEKLRFQEARAAFEEAVAADPDFAIAHLNLAQTQATAKGFFEHLGHAVALADGASEGERLWILGVQAGTNGDPTTQGQLYNQLVELHPDDPRAHNLLGIYYFGLQRYDKAVPELERAVALEPSFSQPYNQLGYSHRFLGDFEAAEKAFKAYIGVIPDDPNPYDSYAELLMKTGRFEESIAQYQKALEVDPLFAASYTGIASNLAYLDRHDEVPGELSKLMEIAVDDGQRRGVHFTAAAVWADQGKLDRAVAEIEAAREIAAAIPDPAAMAGDDVALGNLALQQGRADQAQGFFDRSLEIMEGSGLDERVIANARRAHLANSARASVAAGDLEAAKAAAAQYQQEAEAAQNQFQIWLAHQVNGIVALAEERWEDADAELAQANPLNTFDRFRRAQALEGMGDAEAAKAAYAEVASFNPILGLNHAYVRRAAAAKAG